MPRAIILASALIVSFAGASASAQSSMKPSAPDKMTSPEEAQKMRNYEKQAAANSIKMDERAQYVMDCMTAKK
ncbi:MAG: hypothetical protein ACREB2_03160 [Pseudolabrys sp.]